MDKNHLALSLNVGFASSFVTLDGPGTETFCALTVFHCKVEVVTPLLTGSEDQIQ